MHPSAGVSRGFTSPGGIVRAMTPGMNKVQRPALLRLVILAAVGLLLPIFTWAQAPAAPKKAVPEQDTSTLTPEQRLELLFKKEINITNTLGMIMVYLPQGYRAGATEITQAQYQQVAGANPSKFPGANLPVQMVSWNDAVAFCRLLTEAEQKAGKLPKTFAYSLPTAQDFDFYVDDTPLDQAIVSVVGDRPNPFPVASLPANKYGLYDVRGNVWEWSSTPVARGASYMSHDDYLYTNFRYTATPTTALEDIGFRVVLKSAN
jgi:formylglycine-generating enzyme required for sulfatase activity